MLETTGISPSSSTVRTKSASTSTMSPTWPDIDRFAVDERYAPPGGEQVRVLARHAHRQRAVCVDEPDDLALDLPGQHHAHHVHRLRRGHAQSADELRLDAEPVEHREICGPPP